MDLYFASAKKILVTKKYRHAVLKEGRDEGRVHSLSVRCQYMYDLFDQIVRPILQILYRSEIIDIIERVSK
jgi:hypothetical protein